MNPALARLIDGYFDYLWDASPTTATAVGVHDRDDRLADFDPDAIAWRLEALRSFRRDLDRLLESSPRLDEDEALDAKVFANGIEVEARLLEEVRAPFRDPAVYLDEILYGVYHLVHREFAPLPERAGRAASRLRQVPRLLRQAAANLSLPGEIPEAWLVSAQKQLRGSLTFLMDVDREVVPQAGAAGHDLAGSIREAMQALETFGRHLAGRLAGRTGGSFAIGRGLFDFLVRAHHGLDLDADALHAFGSDLVARTQERLASAARAIDPSRSWQELVAAWKEDHPARLDFLAGYRREVLRARDFVQERGVASLPAGERLIVVETPPFQRSISPFAAYLPPGPFEANQDGLFWVTPPEDEATPQEQEAWLGEHLTAGIPLTVAHEAYPGHHLQLTAANQIRSKVRRVFTTPVLVEGWAFYCEQMMGEEGFLEDPRTQVLQLKDELWRACRVVIDVGIQTRGMAIEEAIRMLHEVARLEVPTARGEAMRYARTATQPLAYAAGKQAILGLREEVRRLRGGRFSLREFHDRFLSLGSIPVSLIRERLLGEAGVSGRSRSPGPGGGPARGR